MIANTHTPSRLSATALQSRLALVMPPPTMVSVVLCVRNGERTLAQQLDALCSQDYQPAWELIVVDNASTDKTRELVRCWASKMYRLRIVDEQRVGANYARNRGIREARSNLIVLCDADDEVSSAWLRTMVDALDRFDLVGGGLEYDRLNPPCTSRPDLQTIQLPNSLGQNYAMGASLGFKKQVFTAIGGFDEAFARGFDEVDFCLLAQDAGYSIGFEPSAIVHYRLRDKLRELMQQHFYYGRGEERLIAKRHRLGKLDERLLHRWKRVAVETAHVVIRLPRALGRRTRRRRLERLAYCAGQIGELAHLTLPTGPRRPHQTTR